MNVRSGDRILISRTEVHQIIPEDFDHLEMFVLTNPALDFRKIVEEPKFYSLNEFVD